MCIAAGDYFSTAYSHNHKTSYLIATFATYIASSATWLLVIDKVKELAVVGALWSLLAMVATVIMGITVFHERPDVHHWVGIVLAVISVGLLSR
jgi:multidrug transporter EmrE-like cation transporter